MAAMTSPAPSRSWISAGCTSAPTIRPEVSVTMWRLRPLTFLAASPGPRLCRARGSAARSTALGGLDRLAVDDAGRRAGFAPGGFTRLQQQFEIDPLKQAVVPPIVE